jgi:hypothetical protein
MALRSHQVPMLPAPLLLVRDATQQHTMLRLWRLANDPLSFCLKLGSESGASLRDHSSALNLSS